MGSSKVVVPKNECFERFLNCQLETLEGRGCPPWIIGCFEQLRDPLLEELRGRFKNCRPRTGRVVALPVIPLGVLSARAQMEMVINEFRRGTSELTESKLGIDSAVFRGRQPAAPYYVLDVEDGRSLLRRDMAESLAEIMEDDRVPLDVPQGIALATHTLVLAHHAVDLPSHRYGTIVEEAEEMGESVMEVVQVGEEVPVIYTMAGQPKLIHDHFNRGAFLKRGVPSRAVTVVA